MKQPKRKRLWFNDGSCIRKRPEYKNHVWSYGFVMDTTYDGKNIRMLTVIDEYNYIRPHSSLGYRVPVPDCFKLEEKRTLELGA